MVICFWSWGEEMKTMNKSDSKTICTLNVLLPPLLTTTLLPTMYSLSASSSSIIKTCTYEGVPFKDWVDSCLTKRGKNKKRDVFRILLGPHPLWLHPISDKDSVKRENAHPLTTPSLHRACSIEGSTQNRHSSGNRGGCLIHLPWPGDSEN